MLVRIYWSLWLLLALSALLLFLVGGLSMMAAVVYGFIAFGLTFMGMIGVLPNLAVHPAEIKSAAPKQRVDAVRTEKAVEGVGVLKSA